jgi:hypothetical protein
MGLGPPDAQPELISELLDQLNRSSIADAVTGLRRYIASSKQDAAVQALALFSQDPHLPLIRLRASV